MIGKVLHPELLVVNLKIQKSVFLGYSTQLDRDLKASEITLTSVGDKTRVDATTAILGLNLSGKSLKVRAKARLVAPANFPNPGAISVAQPEQTIKVKL